MEEPRFPVREIPERQREALCRAWAADRGYPVPKKPGCLLTVLGIICLVPTVVPGLIILAVAAWREHKYKDSMRGLLISWADAWEQARQDEIAEFRVYLAYREQRYLGARYEDLEDQH